jgi:hypothetical protein
MFGLSTKTDLVLDYCRRFRITLAGYFTTTRTDDFLFSSSYKSARVGAKKYLRSHVFLRHSHGTPVAVVGYEKTPFMPHNREASIPPCHNKVKHKNTA